ncbi:hypothetical protein F4679DRAFT_437471 [Xylaria curta]|nr:hypothetical protein F4679DRAFT_437471 [Xylaria curta]
MGSLKLFLATELSFNCLTQTCHLTTREPILTFLRKQTMPTRPAAHRTIRANASLELNDRYLSAVVNISRFLPPFNPVPNNCRFFTRPDRTSERTETWYLA